MFVRRILVRVRFRALACLAVMVVGGCGIGSAPSEYESGSSILDSVLIEPDAGVVHQEADPNDAFDEAQYVQLSEERVTVDGEIVDWDDVDVYDFGEVFVGDHIRVELRPDAALNPALVLFDSSGTCLLVNDHRNVYMGRSDAFLDVVIRRADESCYAAVATTPGYESPGSYQLLAAGLWDQSIPPSRPDVVLLNFEGVGAVQFGSRPTLEIPLFDAADIDPRYGDWTEDIMAYVVERVREDYEGLDVTILSTSEGAVYDESMSRVHFGTYDPDLLGVAEGVDEFNLLGPQDAIVFTDTFEAFMPLNPTVSEISQALANVASHEIGHLLGLVHTADPESIMDVTASLSALLANQRFKHAGLYSAVFPVGYQDALQMLLDTTGGDPDSAFAAAKRQSESVLRQRKDSGGPPARERFVLSSCSLHRFGR